MFDLSQIVEETIDRPPRILLCGREKIGKSTWAAGAPGAIFLPIAGEDGIDAIAVAKTPVIGKWPELLDVLRVLYSRPHDYRTVVIDSVSALEPKIWDLVCEERGKPKIEDIGYAKGYVDAVSHWRSLLDALDKLRAHRGIGSILIGHVGVRPFTDPLGESYDCYQLTTHKSATDLLYRWADTILFANAKAHVSKGEDGEMRGKLFLERKLYTQPRPGHPGGGRGVYGAIPYEIELSYSAFAAAVQAAKGGQA